MRCGLAAAAASTAAAGEGLLQLPNVESSAGGGWRALRPRCVVDAIQARDPRKNFCLGGSSLVAQQHAVEVGVCCWHRKHAVEGYVGRFDVRFDAPYALRP